jgi:superfamily II DNA or RNA helicase
MGLRDISFKPSYDSDEDDILNDFYIPALSKSTSYQRLAGFFSSSALAIAAKGICQLIKNGGTMKLVVGAKLTKQDIEAIEKGIRSREEVLSELMMKDIDSMESEFVKDHVRALAFMIANGKLEIKVVIPLATNQNNSEELEGIYHMKVGLLSDGTDVVSFSGSINESKMGWLHSIEEFKVFCSWMPGQETYITKDKEKFEKYWNGFAKRAIVLDVPTAVKNKLISMAPSNIDELQLEKYNKPERKQLWKNQTEAIEAWVKNGYRGILAMATGSGKTLTALSAAALAEPNVATIILVPTEPILAQWTKTEIPKFDPYAQIIACSSNNPEWKSILPFRLAKLRSNDRENVAENRLYVVALLNTAAGPAFLKAWEGIKPEKIQVICDEVHHIGAPFFQRCMELQSFRRLGLSATPERAWDPVGTEEITRYFGKTIYEYDLKRAIEDGRLCHYRYYPFFAFLNRQEFEEYKELSEQISVEIAKASTKRKEESDVSFKTSRKLERLLEERARIKKKAEDKVRVFRDAMQKIAERPLIVFCEDEEQLSEIETVLKEKGASYLVYTSRMIKWQREKALEIFRKGDTSIMLAIRCLDEGLNVPECEGCVIVASSSSEREFIQRRGRILRSLKGKIAVLNDIIVLPAEVADQEDMAIAEALIRQELERVRQLVSASDNEWESRSIIREELSKYELQSLADI